MAGTDKSLKTPSSDGPTIILVDPQMGENIGAAARGMLNNRLSALKLVRPRDGWPNERADAMSSGALAKMPPVDVYDTVEEAIKNDHFVLATTARPRDMVKPVYTARSAAQELIKRQKAGQKTAVMFGAERTGLTNDDVSLAHGVITIPLNPAFSSLNLGQAVLLVCYEISQALDATPALETPTGNSLPASHDEMDGLFTRLEDALETHNFFRSPEQRPSIIRNLRNFLLRAEMTDQEVRTFHGMISALTGAKDNVK